jgi:hypothetical protein
MDIVIGLVIIAGIAFYVFRNKKVVEEASSPAPYKVEAPVDPIKDYADIAIAQRPVQEAKPVKATKAKAPAKAKAPRVAKPKAPSLKVVKAKVPRKPRAPKTPK